MALTCVPPVGLEPAALGLGREAESAAVVVTSIFWSHGVLLCRRWCRCCAVVHPPIHSPQRRGSGGFSPVEIVLGRESGEHLGQVLGDRLPQDVEVDVEVVVDEAVAHAGGGAPGNVGDGRPAVRADALRGLADDFDELGQCEPQQLVSSRSLRCLPSL